jgi:hypothetical protein
MNVDQFRLITHEKIREASDRNSCTVKSVGEACNLLEGIKAIEEIKLKTKRIFKFSARYLLTDSFNVNFYKNESMRGKYAFKIRDGRNCYETILWSFDGSKMNEFKDIIPKIFNSLLTDEHLDVENSLFHHLPQEEVVELEKVHYEGVCAANGISVSG